MASRADRVAREAAMALLLGVPVKSVSVEDGVVYDCEGTGYGVEMTADPATWDVSPRHWDRDEKHVLRCRCCGCLHPGQVAAAKEKGLV